MRGLGFEPGILHLFTLRGEFLATRLLDQKKKTRRKSTTLMRKLVE